MTRAAVAPARYSGNNGYFWMPSPDFRIRFGNVPSRPRGVSVPKQSPGRILEAHSRLRAS
ncbi:hypothetical protein Hanom_Chr04g00316791 [Helianthus anomalus]